MWPPASPVATPGLSFPADVTVSDLDRRFDDFYVYTRDVLGHSAASLAGYRGAYRVFRAFLAEGSRPLIQKVFAIEEWVAWNRRRKVSPITVNTYWRQLRTFFQDLERRDGITNPFAGLRQPATPTRIAKAFSPDECRRILAAAENVPWPSDFERYRAIAIFATFLYAGLRRGELLRLCYCDVDLQTGTIRILAGKGRGGGKDRTAYIGRDLRVVLTRYLEERRKRRIEGEGFFTSAASGRPICHATLRRIHARVRRASGIAFSLHSLRHSFVTMLLASGVPIHVAQELAGHTRITTTAGYLRVFDDDKRREIEKLSYVQRRVA